MSYRELRNFTEMMRALNYPRQLSIENFRNPNFKLVAEILAWLLKRYDPDSELPLVLDSEQDRVIFTKSACLALIQKGRLKVNPKKLYEADGYAVQELLKVASVLYQSVQAKGQGLDGDDDINVSSITSNINAKMSELRASRALAGQIPEKGATLYDLLNKEVLLREKESLMQEQRSTALARPLELKDVEKSLRSSIKAVEEETRGTLANLNNVASDEANLDAKIEKKRTELERQQKRLAQLQTVRPAYMDEYEKLEAQLKALYTQYVHKFRNLAYLAQLQHEYDKLENERQMEAEISLRKMAEQMREEERGRLAEAGRIDVPDHDLSPDPTPAHKAPRVYGNITGAGLSDDEDEDEDEDNSLLSEDDDEEVVVGGGGGLGVGVGGGLGASGEGRTLMAQHSNGDDLSDFDEEDGNGDEISRMGAGINGAEGATAQQSAIPTHQDTLANSDDDF